MKDTANGEELGSQLVEPVKGTFTKSFSVTDANGVNASGSASVSKISQPFEDRTLQRMPVDVDSRVN